jgi:hypothetical protein
MQFSTALLFVVALMYALGLLGNRTPSKVEECYKEAISEPRNVNVPAPAVWNRCVDKVTR